MCAQRRKALCIVPASPQDWRVVKFGHQEVQNATVGVLQREQFLCQSVEGLAELAGKSRRLGYWCKTRQKSGTVQLLITYRDSVEVTWHEQRTEPSRYWCKTRQKSGTVQLLITETRSR